MDHDRDTDGMNRQPGRRRRAGRGDRGAGRGRASRHGLRRRAEKSWGGQRRWRRPWPGAAASGSVGVTWLDVPRHDGHRRPDRSSSSGSSGPGSSEEASQSLQLQFAQCMRSHRVPASPIPAPAAAS